MLQVKNEYVLLKPDIFDCSIDKANFLNRTQIDEHFEFDALVIFILPVLSIFKIFGVILRIDLVVCAPIMHLVHVESIFGHQDLVEARFYNVYLIFWVFFFFAGMPLDVQLFEVFVHQSLEHV